MVVLTKADRRALVSEKGNLDDPSKSAAGASRRAVEKKALASGAPPLLASTKPQEAPSRVFCPTFGVPFRTSQQVERELFSGYVDAVTLADMLNLPLYNSGVMFTLCYRLTGAGACRTPLITILKILEEVYEKGGEESHTRSSTTTAKRVPLLLLLSAPFLFGEDARLLCEEYQKSLRSQLTAASDITVIVSPACYTEKNVLFALSTAEQRQKAVQEGFRANPSQKLRKHDEPPSALSHSRPTDQTISPLSDSVLREIVSTAVEEVTLRHKNSAHDLSGAVKQLVESLPRDRIANLIDNLEQGRVVLLQTTKGLGEIQQQVRGTQDTLEAVKKDVAVMAGRAKDAAVPNIGDSNAYLTKLCKAVEALKDQMVDSTNTHIKEQLSAEISETLGDVKRSIQDSVNKSLQAGFKSIQEHHESQLTVALREYAVECAKERALTEQTLRDLPRNLQRAMEKALSTLTDQTDKKTTDMLMEQQRIVDAKVSSICESLSKTVERGQECLRETLVDLFRNNSHFDAGASTAADTQPK